MSTKSREAIWGGQIMGAKIHADGAREAGLAKQHSPTGAELESLKQRPGVPASSIIRAATGEVCRGDGVSEYGRRLG